MIWIIAGILVAMVAICFGLKSEKPRRLTPEDYEWGSGKDLSNLLVTRTPIDELEEWWQATQSKDARIRELQSLVASKSSLISKLQSENYELKNPVPIRRGGMEYNTVNEAPVWIPPEWGKEIVTQKPESIYSKDPGKIVVLPSGVSYLPNEPTKVGLKIEGHLADMIMEPNTTTQLTIRNGRVVDWSQSYEDDKSW